MVTPIISCGGGTDNSNNNNNDNAGNQNGDSQDLDTGKGDIVEDLPKVDALSILASLPDEDYGYGVYGKNDSGVYGRINAFKSY